MEKDRNGPTKVPFTISGNEPALDLLRRSFAASTTPALTVLTAAWAAAGFVNDVNVMAIAAPATLVLLVNVSVSTTLGAVPVMVGAAKPALEAVAVGLPPNAGEPTIVITSLPVPGMAAAGVMLMVTVKAAAPARTSGRPNAGPVSAPFKIAGAFFEISSESVVVLNLKLPLFCASPRVAPVHVTETRLVVPALADNFIPNLSAAVTAESTEPNEYPVLKVQAEGLVARYVVVGNVSVMLLLDASAVAGVKVNWSATAVELAITVGVSVRSDAAVTAPAVTAVNPKLTSSTSVLTRKKTVLGMKA